MKKNKTTLEQSAHFFNFLNYIYLQNKDKTEDEVVKLIGSAVKDFRETFGDNLPSPLLESKKFHKLIEKHLK